jgi:hypothetical protein
MTTDDYGEEKVWKENFMTGELATGAASPYVISEKRQIRISLLLNTALEAQDMSVITTNSY